MKIILEANHITITKQAENIRLVTYFAYISALKMEAMLSSETSLDFFQTTRRHIPQGRRKSKIFTVRRRTRNSFVFEWYHCPCDGVMPSLGIPPHETSDMYSGNGRLERDVKQFPRDGTRTDRNISLLFHLGPGAGTDKPEEIISMKGYANHIRFPRCSFVGYFGVNSSAA
jgi:hypothetical protein